MFCDMVGSTALSARLDPEDLHEVIRRYQEACAEVIGRFDGYIGHYVGDGILVYFGFPRPTRTIPRRAVQAGLEIVEAVQALNAEVAQSRKSRSRSGSASTPASWSPATSAPASSATRWRWSARRPNVAARLQALAEPGTVLVGQSTRRLVEGLFVFDELGPRASRASTSRSPCFACARRAARAAASRRPRCAA